MWRGGRGEQKYWHFHFHVVKSTNHCLILPFVLICEWDLDPNFGRYEECWNEERPLVWNLDWDLQFHKARWPPSPVAAVTFFLSQKSQSGPEPAGPVCDAFPLWIKYQWAKMDKTKLPFFRSLDIQRHAHAHRPKGTHVTTDRKLDLSRQDSWTYVGVLETLLVQVSSSKTPQIYTRHRFYTSNNWSDHGALCFTALYSYGLEVIHGSAQHRSEESGHHWDEHEKCACKRKI